MNVKDCILPVATKVIGFMLVTLVIVSSVFPTTSWFTDSMTFPKWLCTWVSVLLLLAVCSLFKFFRISMPFLSVKDFSISVTIACALESLLFMAQRLLMVPKSGMAIAGSFDNVAGFASCLALSIPWGINGIRSHSPIIKWMIIVGKVVCVLGVLCSGSRVGILSLLAIGMVYLKVKRSWLLSALCVALLVLVIGFKHDSSSGRWFIYERSIEMIASKPLLGWGVRGFENNYMQAQADYFRQHGQSAYAMLADNVHHPLSEYLLVGVNFGVFAFLVPLGITGLLLKRLSGDTSRQNLFATMVVLFLFCLFSYPLHYPFAWLMLAVVLLNMFENKLCLPRMGYLAMLVVAITLLFPAYFRYQTERCWADLAEKAQYGLYKTTVPGYQKLMERKGNDHRFLYNYAAVLCEAGNLKLAKRVISGCYRSFKDYEVCLLAANIHAEKGDVRSAEKYYMEAHLMVPSRLMPLDGLFRLYRRSNQPAKAEQVGQDILRLKIKVPSSKAKEIREKVRFDLHHEGNSYD